MDLLERLAYAIARGFARAWFEVQMAARQAESEVTDDKALAVRDRFRAAIDKLRANEGGDPGSVHPPPAR